MRDPDTHLEAFVALCRRVLDAPEMTAIDAPADVGATSMSLIVLQTEIAGCYGVDVPIEALLEAGSTTEVWRAVSETVVRGHVEPEAGR